jgi:hypothetical protein
MTAAQGATNPAKQSCFYVLHAENISEYQDLVSENKSNFHIRKFSKNGDVMFTSCIIGKGEI